MLISYVFIECKVKGIYFITRSASWDCLARQSISIDVLYNREFKSDDEVNISAEDKDVDVTIATDDHNRDFIFIRLRLIYMLRFARLSMWANLKNEDDLT